MIDFLKRSSLNLSVAVAAAFLGAIPLASEAGYYVPDQYNNGRGSEYIVLAAGILFFLTLSAMIPLTRLGSALLDSLGRAETRPVPAVALGLILCGTLCVISSVWLAWSARVSAPEAMARAMQMHANGGNGMSINFSGPAGGLVTSSFAPMILTILAFLLGSSLIGLGVWSSLDPANPGFGSGFSNGRSLKTPIPAADEARL